MVSHVTAVSCSCQASQTSQEVLMVLDHLRQQTLSALLKAGQKRGAVVAFPDSIASHHSQSQDVRGDMYQRQKTDLG